MLADLPGLTQLQISTDAYHLEFVPLRFISNAVLAARACGVYPQVAVCTWSHDSSTAELEQALKRDLVPLPEIIKNSISPMGRASALEEAQAQPYESTFPEGRCGLLNRPVVMEDGTMAACCNVTVAGQHKDSPLVLGNIHDKSLSQLRDQASADYILQAIRFKGPKYLADLVVSKGLGGHLRNHYRQGDICDLCSDLWTHLEVASCIKEALSDPEIRAEIATLRAIVKGETEMLVTLIEEAHPEEK